MGLDHSVRSEPSPELPPNQHLAAPGKWPVVGEKTPRSDDSPWSVTVAGLVRNPCLFSLDDLHGMPQTDLVMDIHCVTRWSRRGARFRGVRLAEVLARAEPLPEARFLSFIARTDRHHSTSLPLADALDLDTLIALEHDGEPLETIHGGPVRIVTPGRYFYKSVKWLERIEALAEDRLGYWEAEAGYHNHADPWQEERYIAPDVSPADLKRLLQERNISGRDLRGVRAEGRDLSGLVAVGASLRDAHFENADLRGADFSGANLSNAHLNGANLTGAKFTDTDVEGAAFDGAILTDTDFTGASLFGTTGLDIV
ncbi:MAG: molybdopterin-dependent oxidoreductase [Armatimonadaceae bacterium]